MKPFIACAVFMLGLNLFLVNVSIAQIQVWSKTPDGHRVSFSLDGIKTNVYYSEEGDWLATMRYVPVEIIPGEIKDLVKRKYAGYKLFFAQDIRTEGGVAWVIKIKNDFGWKTLGIKDGEIIVKESF